MRNEDLLGSPTRMSVSAPNRLPIEARRAAWEALWRRLLQPVPDENSKSDPTLAKTSHDEDQSSSVSPAHRSGRAAR